MRWVQLPTDLLTQAAKATLPDDVWRLLVEFDLLCGLSDGPVEEDYDVLAFRLHRLPEDVQRLTEKLLATGLLTRDTEGCLSPTGWLVRNASYLKKLDYNRSRYYEKVKEAPMHEPTVDELWDAMPGNGGRPRSSGDPLGDLLQGGAAYQHQIRWAGAYSQTKTAPVEVQRASYLLSEAAGLTPYGTKSSWVAAVSELLAAAGNDLAVLEAAVRRAARDRETNGFTLSSPRSFIAYARNQVSINRVKARLEREAPPLLDLADDRDIVRIEV